MNKGFRWPEKEDSHYGDPKLKKKKKKKKSLGISILKRLACDIDVWNICRKNI